MQFSRNAAPLLGLATLAAIGLAARPAAAQTTVYSNDFSGGAGSEWSNSMTDTTPGTAAHAADEFLGQFGNGSTTLTLDSLAPHGNVTVSFDLYVIQSMDGNGAYGGGPDPWSLTADGTTLISTNFDNYTGGGATQGFGGPDGSGGYITSGRFAPQTGAAEKDTLGYYFGDPEDAVYHFTFAFADAAPTLGLTFTSGQTEGVGNEGWGLDNVKVQTDIAPAPEPSQFAGLGLGVLGLAGLALKACKRKPQTA